MTNRIEENQKIEPLLATALSSNMQELADSSELSTGYLPQENRWEVIVRYVGSLPEILAPFPDILYTELSGGYGILRLSSDQINPVASLTQIIYMEKPKRLFTEAYEGRLASCITSLQNANPTAFTGRGILTGIIDSGIDYSHPDFRNEDGSTRIHAIFDQVLGEVFSSAQINSALTAPTREERMRLCPSVDTSGHGTFVAGIAAGNGLASSGIYRGVAYESTLLIVRLGPPESRGFPSTTQLMTAVDYCYKQSIELGMPLALNISFGNTYGSHSGTSLIETYLDYIAQQGQLAIVVGSGNEGASGGRTSGILRRDTPSVIEFSVGDYTTSLSIQLWKSYNDDIRILLRNPASSATLSIDALSQTEPRILRMQSGQTQVLINYGVPSPYSIFQEIYLDLTPAGSYIDSGVWTMTLIPLTLQDGSYSMWMPSSAVRNPTTQFLNPTVDTTLTIPSTASRVITVGAYDSSTESLAAFSGRGNTWATDIPKPDLVAPGVNITSCAPGGGYTQKSGTSMATPFVTGSAACMMQWGMIEGNDPFLYGEKLKAYLHKGARALLAFPDTPNPATGWGRLCLLDSIPK